MRMDDLLRATHEVTVGVSLFRERRNGSGLGVSTRDGRGGGEDDGKSDGGRHFLRGTGEGEGEDGAKRDTSPMGRRTRKMDVAARCPPPHIRRM